MQRLALMMAVMMLGMPPVNGYNTSVGPGSQGAGDQAEMMFPPLHGSATAGKPWQQRKRLAQPHCMETHLWSQEGFQSGGSCNKFSRGWTA
jgi:hypothetical protein